MFDYLVFIGRFQPFHYAHLQTVEIALQRSQSVVLALGSAQSERSLKNPFLAQERENMILSNFTSEQQQRIKFVHIVDVYNDEKWVKQVKQKVNEVTHSASNIGLIGHFKDDSSYYLKLFPNWQLVPLESLKNSISATPLRQAYYEGHIDTQYLPLGTQDFLVNFKQTQIYQDLQQEYLKQNCLN
ncbi:nicotinate-nicotinamide nucleotide adenylyltransferase [Acinetobacter sp. HY1485]|uniref:nicotinate-nicotinamide nucleotide adenylyltransferase n=1 Tax=Acinetobacter sp. HY1485 TaxID=2970918 RepID=UPI0022B9540F|nr:nicotinate-nicotinamide nucleotide adenylyltransferase [Acinetobacter sp. HY1485]